MGPVKGAIGAPVHFLDEAPLYRSQVAKFLYVCLILVGGASPHNALSLLIKGEMCDASLLLLHAL